MGITIVKGDKTLTLELSGTKIHYKRCSLPLFMSLQKASIADERTGSVDHAAVQSEILRKCVIGWEGIIDENDNPVPFDVETIPYFPVDLQNQIAGAICGHLTSLREDNLSEEQRAVLKRAAELGLPFVVKSPSANM